MFGDFNEILNNSEVIPLLFRSLICLRDEACLNFPAPGIVLLGAVEEIISRSNANLTEPLETSNGSINFLHLTKFFLAKRGSDHRPVVRYFGG